MLSTGGDYAILDLVDGAQAIIFPPSMATHRKAAAYHRLLLSHARSQYLADPAVVFEAYRRYFENVFNLLDADVSLDDIDERARHRFFICLGLRPHPTKLGEQILDISELELLMDLQRPGAAAPPQDDPTQIRLTSGSAHIDLHSQLMISLANVNSTQTAEHLMASYSCRYLRQLSAHLIDLAAPDKARERINAQRDEELTRKRAQDFEAMLAKAGFNVATYKERMRDAKHAGAHTVTTDPFKIARSFTADSSGPSN